MDDLLSSRQKLVFACFACRSIVKHEAPFYYQEHPDIFERGRHQRLARCCPRCAGPAVFVGRYFKAPPRSELAQWRKAEALWRAGWRADGVSSCGLSIRTPREARTYGEQRSEQRQARASREQHEQSAQIWKQASRSRKHPR